MAILNLNGDLRSSTYVLNSKSLNIRSTGTHILSSLNTTTTFHSGGVIQGKLTALLEACDSILWTGSVLAGMDVVLRQTACIPAE